MDPDWNADYQDYKSIFEKKRFPLAFVDLDRFDKNIDYVASTQKMTGKTIRIASKSIRCLTLIKRIFEKGKKAYKGILAFTMEEAGFLFDNGLDDIVVAYPSIQQSDVSLFVKKTCQGANISLMVDSVPHLETLSLAGEKAGTTLKVCLDIDMSYRPLDSFGNLFGAALHIGVRRSPLHTTKQIIALVKKGKQLSGIKIVGLMGYEAQIASVNDNLPSKLVKNAVLKMFKKASVKELTQRRSEIVKAAINEGITPLCP